MHIKKIAAPVLFMLLLCSRPAVQAAKERDFPAGPAVLWNDPGDVSARDLFYGSGGKEHVPQGPFTFVKEDLNGTNPKFVVRDAGGHKWKVKLGNEAQPETVAARIVWAVGYYANEDYFLESLQVQGLPAHLHRGEHLIGPDGTVSNVRLKREDEKKLGTWQWRHNPFTATREFNGLKVLMGVINNWDLKDENNAIFDIGGQQVYLISDLGASFGAAGRSWSREKSKGDLDAYRQSPFIRKIKAGVVDFAVPARPRFIFAVNPKEYTARIRLEWIGKDIPRADAKWLGDMLARLSPKQIQDAFRAAGYAPEEAAAFADVMQLRISALTAL